MLNIVQIPVMQDNYIYVLHDDATGKTAVVDPAEAAPVNKALKAHGWSLDYIFNTHHHWDHIGANLELKAEHGLTIVGPKADQDRIPGIDVALTDGDTFNLGDHQARVMDVPGHTKGHIAWYFEAANALFCGDTLFALGCGRLFEGTPAQMLDSLDRIATLPDDTQIYCAHEYTLSNGRFAVTIDPENVALAARMRFDEALRGEGKPTVPSLLGLEKETNPFLRSDNTALAKGVGLQGADRLTVFTRTRELKDSFSG